MIDFALFPERASQMAEEVDNLFVALLAICGLVEFGVFAAMIAFAFKYHRRNTKADRTPRPMPLRAIELSWTLIPLFIFLGLFYWAAHLYYREYAYPADALEIQVLGKMWMWKVRHPGGQQEIDTLHVPVGRPVKLLMTSADVIHSFFIPAFRLKQDVLPWRYTTEWFQANKVGVFHLFCAEYCGAQHSQMVGTVVAMAPTDYGAWLAQQPPSTSIVRQGEGLFRRFGCSGCHGANSSVHAPDLHGIFARPVPLEGGSFVTADETYLRDSILLPNKQIVAGYKPQMPSFEGQIREDELLSLIAYIKNIPERSAP